MFGLLEVKGQRRRPVLKFVKRRTQHRLMPIIQRYVRPGSDVLSDSWPAYRRLQQNGYIHYQVNHRRFFIHPTTGAHTQHIERAWRNIKNDVYHFRANMTEQKLKECLSFIEWDYWLAKKNKNGALGQLIEDIRYTYRV